MSKPKKTKNGSPVTHEPGQKVSLKFLADYLGLSPATLSLVMNRSAVADSIPKATKDQIFAAAQKFNYRPNFMARSLRTQRSFTIGVLVPEISEGYETLVMSGIEEHLLQEGYFYFVASHHHRADLIDEYPKLLLERSVEGLIAVDTALRHALPIPVVAVSGRNDVKGVTNILLNHRRAAELALEHLFSLGHRRIAFVKGQEFSSDTESRWESIVLAAKKLGLTVHPKLAIQLEGNLPTSDVGYQVTRRLLGKREPFSAMFTFNDISAIGAIRALREEGLCVPEDISVVGFDDIQSASFQNPALTTVRQPLRKMGKIAAETVLRRIVRDSPRPAVARNKEAGHPDTDLLDINPIDTDLLKEIIVEPELVVRESTGEVTYEARQKHRPVRSR
ncbi:MAG TPA: LacI family DNA-binding transcriptional regulator [Terriglobales bacterium]|nr:LacI family DNA-binding transcriptional regulator [Terriglobales bacterium]